MKIAIIGTVSSSLFGFRSLFIQMLIREGHTVYALAMDYTLESEAKVKILGAIPIRYEIQRFGLNPFVDIKNTIKLRGVLSGLQIDVCLSYFSKPVIFGTLAARLAKVPKCVGMLEGLGHTFTVPPEGAGLKTKLIKLMQEMLYKCTLPQLDRLILLNEDDKRDLIERNSINVKSVVVLGGIGLDLNEFPYVKPLDSDNVNFTFVGRLLKEKGVDYFISAAEIVKARYPQVTFTILGAPEVGSTSSTSMVRLKILCQSGVIEYPGQVMNVPDWLAACSVFVLPSYYREGVPRSTQEAMAIGRAVITTDVPGCRDTVEHKRNGILIPAHDIGALVEAMSYFLENPELVTKMGLESHKMAFDKFDANKVNERLYRMIID